MDKLTLPKIGIPKVTLPQIALCGHIEGKPTRNLLLNSGRVVSNDKYNIAQYPFSHPEWLTEGRKVTCTIWGELAEGFKDWLFYNTDGTVPVAGGNQMGSAKLRHDPERRMYTAKAYWTLKRRVLEDGPNQFCANTHAQIYQWPQAAGAASTIDHIKLELGWNDNPVWSPAPEDKNGIAVTLELLDDSEATID